MTLEAFLARLYTNRAFRSAFLADRAKAAKDAALDQSEIPSVLSISEDALELAAESYAKKAGKFWILGVLIAVSCSALAQESRRAPTSRPAVDLTVSWIHGSKDPKSNTDPPIQVHRYDENTFILRQNKAVHYEAPFMYLLIGDKRALLQDTGATASAEKCPIRDTVEKTLGTWLAAKTRPRPDLVVTHSHAHGDHVAGDKQFRDAPQSTVLGHGVPAIKDFFGITDWPSQIVQYDLGGRTLHVIPIPGHEPSHIALYDERTQCLFTGDTLYPGRLYVSDFPAYRDSIARLSKFAASHPITYILGTHIEMTRKAGLDYPAGTRFQPEEHVLQLAPKHLSELHSALQSMGDKPRRDVHDDFIIWPK